jgi:hypothetical protein
MSQVPRVFEIWDFGVSKSTVYMIGLIPDEYI